MVVIGSRHTIQMPPPAPGTSDAVAWFAPTSDLDSPGALDAALTWLTPRERARYDRFRGDEDRRMFLLGRVMARALVGRQLGVAPTAWPWREGPRGRPEIAWPDASLHFNLAHSAGLVACVVASGREVGVDLEDLGRRRIDWAVVERYCAPGEIADIAAHGDRWHDRFLHYWTLKEAYLKARGVGISVPLEHLGFQIAGPSPQVTFSGPLAGLDTRWKFQLRQVTNRHLIAVAVSLHDDGTPGLQIERLTNYLPSAATGGDGS
jgi:4'-phosphopantetheinyl transferase